MATIYEIKNLVNGFSYIGCTSGKLNKRMREHRCLLKQNAHKCTQFQKDWNKYGAVFDILVLEDLGSCSLLDKRQAEVKWMTEYKRKNRLYNEHIISFRPSDEAIAKGIEASRHVAGNRWTPEANLKRSLSQLGIHKGHGAKISATKKANKLKK